MSSYDPLNLGPGAREQGTSAPKYVGDEVTQTHYPWLEDVSLEWKIVTCLDCAFYGLKTSMNP